jgi:undecaprenyl-diphosphatase
MKKKEVCILAAILILSILFLNFDAEIVKSISYLQNSPLNSFFLIITFLSSEIIIFLFITALLFPKRNKRQWILPSWITLALSVIVSFILKISIRRQRPFQLGIVPLLENLAKSSHEIWNFSFPSFSTLIVFSLLPIISKEFPKIKYWFFSFACLVAISRVYFGLHFLSDVLMGALIGYLIGFFIIKLEDKGKIWTRVQDKILRN